MHPQQSSHALSLQSPTTFWSHHASQLYWHRQPSSTVRFQASDRDQPGNQSSNGQDQGQGQGPQWTWFPDGEISTSYNCLDRHVHAGHGSSIAIIHDSPVTGTKETYTYAQLLDEVEVLAGALREEGITRGDVVIIYMPMIPAALIAALAITRLGAIHAAVFGGFAAQSLAQRIEAASPKAIMTASCGIEGKKVIPYRPLVEDALRLAGDSQQKQEDRQCKTFIWQRDQHRWNHPDKRGGQRNWQRVVKSARARGVRAAAVPVRSDEGVYIIYTSGTTGLPKGVLREAGGHAVGLHLSMHQVFNIHRGDTILCASDIGWVVGHSYILYGPLLVGATTVLFEGKPVGTPDASTFWRIIHEYHVNVLFTAPTALRAIRRDDPDNTHFLSIADRDSGNGLKSLKALFLAGERSEPSIVSTFQDLLARHASPGAMVVDNWWSSESGSPMTALALNATLAEKRGSSAPVPVPPKMKPGSAGLPTPGFDIRIVDDEGALLPPNSMGNIVLGLPLAPTAFTRLFGDTDNARFYKSYLARFVGRWFDTGDAGMVDTDGYVHVMARSDDIINVAAHRFSTGAIEQVLLSHPRVAEAVVVGVPDALKGHLPFAFITSTPGLVSSASTSVSVSSHGSTGSTGSTSGDGTGTGTGTGTGNTGVGIDTATGTELNNMVRSAIGAIASLGGIIDAPGIIPKTRSGKTLRRVLRELLENGSRGEFNAQVNVPPTVEDIQAVERARQAIKEYYTASGSGPGSKAKTEAEAENKIKAKL